MGGNFFKTGAMEKLCNQEFYGAAQDLMYTHLSKSPFTILSSKFLNLNFITPNHIIKNECNITITFQIIFIYQMLYVLILIIKKLFQYQFDFLNMKKLLL